DPVLPANAAVFDHAPSRGLEGGVDVLGARLGFVHRRSISNFKSQISNFKSQISNLKLLRSRRRSRRLRGRILSQALQLQAKRLRLAGLVKLSPRLLIEM